ncbi:MAG: hypothetical protein GX573_11105, partial [Chloroflexi bacterium]|nr:hypothetical protein [Chloroflexota bacterium]
HHIPPGIPVPDLDIVKRQYLTLFERGCLYTTAFQGLLDWPHGFFDYLDAYRQRPVFDAKETGLRREFGVLYMSWFEEYWKHPGFEFVQTAFNDYLVERLPAYMVAFSKRAYDPDLLYRLDYLTIEQAARYVECPARAVRRLVAEGHLTAHHFDYFEQEDRLWVSRHELDQLLQQWEGHLTAPEVAQMLGITLEIARELIATPLLEVVPDDAGKQWMLIYVYRHSVLQFIQRLKKHTTILANPQLHGVSIAEVSIHNGSIGLGFPEIWQRICDGKLTACHPHESLFPLTDLWFWPETVANISQTVKDEHDWITLMETLDCLGVKRPVLDHFLEAGLFQPVKAFGQKQFFRRSDVEALRDCAVSSRQAAELLNTSLSRFLELNRQGYFSPLSGPGINRHTHYIFDRHELLAWHKEYLVMSELKQLVGVDPYVFLREHRILPVFRKPSVYLRREVMAVISAEMS